jgi:regulatory protein YycI of two-component signal transduction system YycFG
LEQKKAQFWKKVKGRIKLDWNKAKNIFIAMFLIINIFLSYQLYTISRNQYIYIEEEEIDNIEQYLARKNVQMDAIISDRVLIAPKINVKYHEFDIKKIEELFFGSVEYQINNTDHGFDMKYNELSVEVKDGFYVTFQDKSIDIKQKDVNEEKCIKNAYNFINKLQLNTGNQFTKIKEVGKGYVHLVLGQEYGKLSVDTSLIDIIATEEGVVEAKISWLEWIKPDKRLNIITPVMALLKAYGSRAETDETIIIKQIRQGYHFTPEVQDAPNDAIILEGTLSPMWIIESDKADIYINAYNEKIE